MLMSRYLFKNLTSVTVFVALTLTMVICLTQSLNLLELVANSDAPPGLFLELVGLSLPKFLEIILPLSLVTAILFTYHKMIMDNELIVLRASGVDQYALARPAITLALISTILVLSFSTYLTPKGANGIQSLRQTIKTQYSAFLLREGVFNTFSDKLTVYLKARDDNGDMTGLMIHDTRDKDKPPVTIVAKRGQVVMDGDTPDIVVFDGMRQQRDATTGELTKLYFSRYTIEIKGVEGEAKERWRGAGERTLPELLSPDLNNRHDRNSVALFLAEANHRVTSPWNALGFSMIALCCVLLGPFNRRGMSRRLLAGVVLVAASQALNLTLVNLSRKYLGVAPLVVLNTVLPIAVGFYLLHISGEQKVMALWRRWNARGEQAA